MSSPPAAPRRSSAQSDQPPTDNLNFQYPLSDSDSSLIEHPSTTIMDSDTNSEDGLGYLSDSTYEIISQSSFQASDSEDENEDDGPGLATPQDTDVESVEEFGAATPSETSACEEPDASPIPPGQREMSFEEQRLRDETAAEAGFDEGDIYTPEELEIHEQLSIPSLNTSTIRGTTVTTTSASNSIEDWINFREPITSVADGLLNVNVTNEKQDIAASTIENNTFHVVDQVEEAAHNAVEACINLINTVSRYVRTHVVESAYQRMPSRDSLIALLPEDPRASMPSLWAIAAFLVTPFLINCIVTLAQSGPSAPKVATCLSDGTCIPKHLLAEAKRNVNASLQARVESIASRSRASVASIASKSTALARSEIGLSIFEPTTKPHAGWFAKAKAEAKAKPDFQSPWKINSGNQTGRFVLQHNKPLNDQFQVNISSSQQSRSILFNPRDDTMHYPESEESTMQSKIFRFNQTAVELQLPPSWPCGNLNVSVMPYLKEPPYIVTSIFLTEKFCEPAPSWKDFAATVTRLCEKLQAHLARQAENLRPTESTVDARPSTVDGRCGAAHSGSVCAKWSGGSCCSKFGWCGNSSSHCGAGCQSGCKNSLIALPALPKLPKLPHLDTRKLPTPREITQFLKDDLQQTREELRARADLFWEKLKEMNIRMTEYSAKSREERQLRREMKRAKTLHRKLHRASEPGLPSLPVKKARTRALKLRDRADAALKRLQFRFQQWEARIGREYLA